MNIIGFWFGSVEFDIVMNGYRQGTVSAVFKARLRVRSLSLSIGRLLSIYAVDLRLVHYSVALIIDGLRTVDAGRERGKNGAVLSSKR